MKIYYNNEHIGDSIDSGHSFQVINQYLKDINYKSYYFNMWHKDDGKTTVVDYGSHVNFFYIKED